jgi:hypothetical protein
MPDSVLEALDQLLFNANTDRDFGHGFLGVMCVCWKPLPVTVALNTTSKSPGINCLSSIMSLCLWKIIYESLFMEDNP